MLEQTGIDAGNIPILTSKFVQRSSTWYMLELPVLEDSERHVEG